MPQHHKGDRRLTQARLPEHTVYAEVARRAARAGTSVSQYVADVVALHTGFPQEVRAIGRTEQEEIQLAV